MSKYKNYKPEWETVPPPERSFRSILKWGNPIEKKDPNEGLYTLIKKQFGLEDKDFLEKRDEGLEEVPDSVPSGIAGEYRRHFISLLGEEYVLGDTYSRLKYSYGKTMYDTYRLREGVIENIADLVLQPETHEQIQEIVHYASRNSIPVYVFGGGSTVTRGCEAVKGGISLDLSTRFNKVIGFNEKNQTITVQAGMWGPQLEELLNNAPEHFGAGGRYTCGHFPQSFEYSSVGGWIVTRGAGQNSTYYGNIKDIVYGQVYATPRGAVSSYHLPAHAVGPDIDEIMMGSEGTFGILTDVTLKVFRYMPENRRKFSYIFSSWEKAREASREIMQAEAGYPSVFRISDPEETDVMLKLYQVEGTVLDTFMSMRGYKPMERCLFLGWSEGERGYSRNAAKNVRKICKKYGALPLTGYPAKKWEEGRFKDPYMREALQDYGIIIDTMECGVSWDSMEKVHSGVRRFAKSRPGTVCMTHISHAYPQGANLYFIFIGRFKNKEEYLEYQYGLFDNIRHYGASMSHHHGVGKVTSRWVRESIGDEQLEIFKALRNHFDPNGVMNPGGTLALDTNVLHESNERRPRFAGRTWDDPAY